MTTLEKYFIGISVKCLSAVETQLDKSNQHEFNGTAEMKQYLGLERKTFNSSFLYAGKDEDSWLSLTDQVTWYDSREKHPTRSEHRLYFSDNAVMESATEGDILISALAHDGNMTLFIVSSECPDFSSIMWLFGISEPPTSRFTSINPANVQTQSRFLFNLIAEQVGLDISENEDNWLPIILDRFGDSFPRTRDLSAFALETLMGQIDPIAQPDETLISLIDREELLFKQLEKHIVSLQLKEKRDLWADNIDDFMHFSLGVHNRRKSRAGHALENHLEWILAENHLMFERGASTEARSKPDFLFPSSEQYQNMSFPASQLTMLGVKTTCKDRWRQVLNEAHRIPHKHLLTLQPRISEFQMDEMQRSNLSLVIPSPIQTSYPAYQGQRLLTVSDFVEIVKGKQFYM